MYIMAREKCKAIDNETINNIGIPSIVLMENAASEITNKIKKSGNGFLVVCGKGNNGGDGLAIARKLHLLGKSVQVVVVATDDNYSEDFTVNLTILNNMGVGIFYVRSIEELEILREKMWDKDLIIDAIFGVGLARELNEFYCATIEMINKEGIDVISIDVPSGLDCELGRVKGSAIRAIKTYTFEVLKKGFLEYEALKYLGDVEVVSIGIPKEIKEKHDEGVYKLSEEYYRKIVPRRRVYGHKGNYGKAVLVAGSKGMSGAAYIASEACVRAGAGTVTVITSEYVQGSLSSKLIEAMIVDYKDDKVDDILECASVIGIGPGMGQGIEGINIIKKALDNNKKIVLDADGLNIVSKSEGLLTKLKGKTIITPHPGEMARLINNTIDYVEQNRVKVAKEFAKKYNLIVVLKGYHTVISDGDKVIINFTGSSKMASGGMGDCLTGIITSFIAQGMELLEGAALGCFIHGYVGDSVGKNKHSVVATDIINNFSDELEKFKGNK